MSNVITIHDAKTNLSKLIKQVEASGQALYIGAYGKEQVMLAPVPSKKHVRVGMFDHKWQPGMWNDDEIMQRDPDLATAIDARAAKGDTL